MVRRLIVKIGNYVGVSKLNLEPTPMIGGVFGKSNGAAPGSRIAGLRLILTHSFSVTQVKLAASSVLPLPL